MNKAEFCKDARPGPLNGILIVSCEQLLAGPYCTKLLWELGATVLRVEPPEGDIARSLPPFVNGQSVYFGHVNYGKKCIALDLAKESDRKTFAGIINHADVFFENMPAGYLDELRFDKAFFDGLNRDLIRASLTGFGKSVSRRNVAYDVVIQAMSGLMSVTGFEGAGPVRVGAELGDITGATYMAIAILAALFDRENNEGSGTGIDIGLLDSLATVMEGTLLNYSISDVVPKPKGNREPAASPFDLYQCQDKKITVVCANQNLYETFCKTLKSEHLLTDDRFTDNPKRVENADDLKVEINKVLSKMPAAEVIDLLTKAGVPISPVNHVRDLFEHPQVKARNMIVALDSAAFEGVYTSGNPIKLSDYPEVLDKRPEPPAIDCDRDPVMKLVVSGPDEVAQ